MKILYITKGDHVDYQDDCLFIGLRELYGSDVVDYNKREVNYISYEEEALSRQYGWGMTVGRVLPDIEIDRTDITSKIKNNFFDLIVYGSIWRCSDYFEKVLEYYPREKVIIVDGEDLRSLNDLYKHGTPYFKRELMFSNSRLLPISFSFPTSKVNFCKQKNRDYSFITPLDRSTYIYQKERDYFNDYRESRLGVTMCKRGWDCMRHYEILGNGCIPLFLDLKSCPSDTMVSFPKDLCISVERDLNSNTKPSDVYEKYIEQFEDHFMKNNTTLAAAKQFIATLEKL